MLWPCWCGGHPNTLILRFPFCNIIPLKTTWSFVCCAHALHNTCAHACARKKCSIVRIQVDSVIYSGQEEKTKAITEHYASSMGAAPIPRPAFDYHELYPPSILPTSLDIPFTAKEMPSTPSLSCLARAPLALMALAEFLQNYMAYREPCSYVCSPCLPH